MFECGSNGIVIANGSSGPAGNACLYGSDYEYTYADSEDQMDAATYISQNQALSGDMSITLGEGRWMIRALLTTKNTDATGHTAAVRLLKDGGAITPAGSVNQSVYLRAKGSKNMYVHHNLLAMGVNVAAGTTAVITMEVTHAGATGTYFGVYRQMFASKITNYTDINP
jgi:hypothetical protein